MKKRIIIGITGASGVIYGIRALQHLSVMDDGARPANRARWRHDLTL